MLCKAQCLPTVLTAAQDFGLCPGKPIKNMLLFIFFLFFQNTGTESMWPGTRVPAFGGRNTGVVDVHQKIGQSFLLCLLVKREPVVSLAAAQWVVS